MECTLTGELLEKKQAADTARNAYGFAVADNLYEELIDALAQENPSHNFVEALWMRGVNASTAHWNGKALIYFEQTIEAMHMSPSLRSEIPNVERDQGILYIRERYYKDAFAIFDKSVRQIDSDEDLVGLCLSQAYLGLAAAYLQGFWTAQTLIATASQSLRRRPGERYAISSIELIGARVAIMAGSLYQAQEYLNRGASFIDRDLFPMRWAAWNALMARVSTDRTTESQAYLDAASLLWKDLPRVVHTEMYQTYFVGDTIQAINASVLE